MEGCIVSERLGDGGYIGSMILVPDPLVRSRCLNNMISNTLTAKYSTF